MSVNEDFSAPHFLIDRTIRILLIEERLGSQRAAYELLMRLPLDCVIEMADTGGAALEKIKSQFYDLIFMDIDLPDMSGIALTKHLRDWEKGQSKKPVPVMALTVSAEPYACYRAGMQEVISKPMTEAMAMKLLEKYVIPEIVTAWE